jgi:TP901 family phage tail tape measure protein
MNLTVNVLANLAGFMSGMTQLRQIVQQTGTQMQAAMTLPSTPLNTLQAFRERATQVAFAVGAITAGLGAMSAASVLAFARQEQAFAGILKTVDATDKEFAQLRANLTALSNRTPIPFNDLARIGELAGQLGVRGVENLTKFTDTVAKISVTTNLTAENAATSFARIANIMQVPAEEIGEATERMGSTIVDLGNKFATTEAEISEFALRIAGAGKIAGLTTADVFGLATAFSSVGIKAEAGGTAVQKMLIAMTQAVAGGGEKLRIFAETAGLTDKAFQTMFRTKPVEAFTKVIEGLSSAGEEAFDILGAIVGEEARFLRAMLSMSGAGDLLARATKTASTAWEENIALIVEAEKRFATFSSMMQVLRNNIENFAASLGEALMPALKPLVVGLTTLFAMFQSLPGPIKTFIAVTVAAGAVIGTIVVAIAGAIAAFTALASAVGGMAVMLVIAKWVGIAILAIAALGTAVIGVVKFFGLFTESSNQLEARLRSQSGETKTTASAWQQFGKAVSEVWVGLKVVSGEVWDSIWSGVSEATTGIWVTVKGWGAALHEAWTGIWTDIKTTFLGLWNSIPDSVKTGVLQILSWLNPLKGLIEDIGGAWDYLRGRGKQALDAERQRQRELDLEMKRELARGTSMREATEKNFKAAGFSVEEFDAKLRKSHLANQQVMQGLELGTNMLRLAVASGTMSEEQALQRTLEILDIKEQAVLKQFNEEMALVGKMSKFSKERQEKEDEAIKRRQSGEAAIQDARVGIIEKQMADETKRVQHAMQLLSKEEAGHLEFTNTVLESRRKLTNELMAFGRTEFEQFVAQERERASLEAIALEESGAGLEAITKRFQLMDQRIQEFLTKGAAQAQRELDGLAASVGLTGEAAFKAQQAFVLYGKAYKDLNDEQRRNVDTNAQSLAQLEELAKKTQALALVHAALLTGYGKEIGLVEAMRVADIKLREQQLASVLDYYKTLNNAAQNEARVQAEIDQEIARNKGDLYKFLGATTRRWVADQENVWAGFGRMITNTFDNINRTLSDVFFNLFTGQTVKLKDVWKSMLDAMLRELANFLAAQTVRTFLGLLGNLLNGRPATEGLFGGAGTGTGAASGSTGGASIAGGLVNLASSGLSGLASLFGSGSSSSSTSSLGSISGSSGSAFSLGSSVGSFDTSYLDSFSFASGAFTPTFDLGGTQTGGFYMASGGRVPGSGRGDTVPAMLEPGEFVVRRDVAQQLGPVLDLVNRGGAPRPAGGRLHFAEGGVVPSISGDQAIINLLYAIYQQNAIQTGAAQQTAANTGATAAALGEQPATSTASTTTISGVGGNVQAGTAPASGGAARSSGGGSGGGGTTAQFDSTDAILALLRGGTGIARSGANLLTGLTGTGGTGTAQTINALLGVLSGGLNLASGISSGNSIQTAGGSISLLGSVSSLPAVQGFLNTTFGSSLIGSGSTAIGAGGIVSSSLGIAGGALGLYTSIQDIIANGASAGNITQAVLSAYGVYAAAAPLIGAATGTVLPTFTSMVSSALASITGSTLASAGTTAGIGVGASAATGLAAGGATAAGSAGATAAASAATGLVGGIAASLVGAMVIAVQVMNAVDEKNAFDRRLFDAKKTIRTAIPEAIERLQQVPTHFAVINNPASTPQQVRAAFDQVESAVNLYNTYDAVFRSGKIHEFPVPGLTEVNDQLAPFLNMSSLAMIRAVDRLAVTAPELVPTGSRFANPLTFATTAGVNATGQFQPTGITGTDLSSMGANYTQGALPSAGLILTGSGYYTSSIYNQIASLQPGNLEQGLFQAAQLYGTPSAALAGIGFGGTGSIVSGATPLTAVPQASIAQAQATAAHLEQIKVQSLAADQAWFDMQAASSPGGLQTGGWVPGRGYGDHVPMLLEPGEFVVPRPQAQQLGARLHNLLGEGAAAQVQPTTMPITINITVHGNVDDPHELAERLAPVLRDQLRRIDTRYSRAGNKSQV